MAHGGHAGLDRFIDRGTETSDPAPSSGAHLRIMRPAEGTRLRSLHGILNPLVEGCRFPREFFRTESEVINGVIKIEY